MLDDNGNNIIWTLCHHGHVIKDSAYILEKLMNVLPEESLKNNLDLLLLSGVKVFLQSPAESQHILGRDHLRLEFRFRNLNVFFSFFFVSQMRNEKCWVNFYQCNFFK